MKQRADQAVVRYACRATRHWMEHVSPRADWRRPDTPTWHKAWAILHYECQRPGCEVWRHDAIDGTGYLLARKYERPDWYELDADEERPTADELRLWMHRRESR